MKSKHLLIIAILTFIAGCTKDNTNVTPLSTDNRDKFIGSWLCNEGTGTPFTIEISKLSGDEINIKNFSNYGNHGNAKCVVTDNSFVIFAQDFNDLPGVSDSVSSGSGTYSKSGSQEKIKMIYNVNGVTFNNVTCTK